LVSIYLLNIFVSQNSSLTYGGELESIGIRMDEWHVGAGLTPYNLIQTTTGNTFAKLSTLGLIREESVVTA